MKKFATVLFAVAALAVGLIAISPDQAEAGWRRGWGYAGPGPAWGYYGYGYRPYAYRPYYGGYYPYAYYPYWRGRTWRRGWGY